MKTLCCATYLLVGICVSLISASTLPEAKLTVKLVDESGSSLAGLPVTIGFSDDSRHGVSDTNGCFSATGRERFGDPRCGCDAKGYYSSDLPYLYSGGDTNSNRWTPWNPVVTMLVKRVVNPIPMYAKVVETAIPSTTEPCAYDLMVGDWLAPNGRGVVSDLVFKIGERRVLSLTNCNASLLLTFAKGTDGAAKWDKTTNDGSDFRSPYVAPLTGYSGAVWMAMGYLPGRGYYESNDTVACCIRVRTTTNELGTIIQANYGKISGPITFDGRNDPAGWLKFIYYLNPVPNDRNLEFDPKRNLFKDLKSTEEVTSP